VAEKDVAEFVLQGRVLVRDVRGCHISTTRKRIAAAIGIQNLTIIDTDDALLVCARDRSQEVRDIVEALRKSGLTKNL
jgi:mannose-1-phosphate guanylyltransferase